VTGRRNLVVEIETKNVMVKFDFQEKKIGLREKSSLAILIEVEEDLQTREEMQIETNLEIRKNHTMEIEILEEDHLVTEAAEVEINMVTNLLEEEVVAVVDTVTNLLEEEAAAEVEAIMEIEMVETITEEETLGIDLTQAENSLVERKILGKSESLRTKVIGITNVNLNNYSKV